MNKRRIEKEKKLGKIKPMHCGNNVAGLGGDCNGLYKDLKIPYTRLHDSATIERHLVDTTSVFPNFDADENGLILRIKMNPKPDYATLPNTMPTKK